MINWKWFYPIILVVIFTSCSSDMIEPFPSPPKFMEIPNGFDAIPQPEDNVFTQERWELGKKLFYDPIMSVDNSTSCFSCHKPQVAFGDDLAFSEGVENRIGTRNAPSLANVAYHPYLTREGGVPTLEMQVLVPIQEHNEFDFNIVLLAERLAQDSNYVAMAKIAYDREPDAFVITRAISCFERSLISGYSPYDQFAHYNDPTALNEDEQKGMDLFFSDRTNCSSCHSSFNFTNYQFANNGLYEVYQDEGRYRLTSDEEDLAMFKIPSLRNVALTGPYMHDGSIQSLRDIVDHYNTGGNNHSNKSELIKPLDLTNEEKENLVAFLMSLTDDSFINNPAFKN